jgi:hypothetical protein
MTDVFADPAIRAGASMLILCVLIAAAFFIMAIFRDYTAQDRENPEDVLANLREMHVKGDISDEEFRTIQSATHSHLQGATTADGSQRMSESSTND